MSGDMITSGPIVACDNAIKHYDEQAEAYDSQMVRLAAELERARNSKKLMLEMRQQWVDAKARLQA